MGRQPALIGREPAQEVQPLAPQLDLDEVLHAAEGRAQHHEQDLRQGIDDAPALTRIGQRREMIEDRHGRLGRGAHERLRTIEAAHESYIAPHGAVNLKRLPWLGIDRSLTAASSHLWCAHARALG